MMAALTLADIPDKPVSLSNASVVIRIFSTADDAGVVECATGGKPKWLRQSYFRLTSRWPVVGGGYHLRFEGTAYRAIGGQALICYELSAALFSKQ